MKKPWNMIAEVVPVVIRALGRSPINLKVWLDKTRVKTIENLHFTIILYSTRFILKVLGL